MKQLLLTLLLVIPGISALTQPFPNGYSFYLPPDDSTSSLFLPDFPVDSIEAGEEIGINADGDFVKGNQPIRFWGANITAAGAFPPKSKAAEIAARMRKMGINLIRFHHLDNPWAGNDGSIFINSQGTRALNPVTVDRLMYFIAALKRNGIYVNMNLNVSRTFRPQDGVADADSLVDFGKVVTIYDPWLVQLQQEYADQLLSHVNPYTGLSLKDDPVLAMVEVINENSIYGFWKGDRLQAYPQGGVLIRRHADMLDSLWHDFLIDKYQTDANLIPAWDVGAVAPGQNNQILDAGFESGNVNTDWILELHSTAAATVSADASNPFEGTYSAQVDVTQVTGTGWHLQFLQTGLSMQQDSSYAVTFAARADANRVLTLGVMQHVAPYDWYGGGSFQLTSSWQTFTYTFTAPTDLQGDLRITFGFDNQVGTFWFDDVSLAPPSRTGLETGESLQAGNIKRVRYSERLVYTPQRVADLAEFYIQLQKDFLIEMNDYLKNDIGVSVPITGTNALVGPADVMHQETLDYIDDHNYWDHPWFPNNPWDPYDWLINNTSSLKDPDVRAMSNIFSGLTMSDRPYTISEFNQTFPNRFQAEMMPMLTAYASFHGADGLMFYDYEGGTDWDSDMVGGFFSIQRNTALMSLMPACAYAYRNYLIAEADQTVDIEYTPDFVWQAPQVDGEGRWGKWLPYDKTLGLTHAVKTTTYQASAATDFSSLPAPSVTDFLTTTGQIRLQTDIGLHTTAAEEYVSIGGFLADAPNTEVGDLNMISGDGFGVLTWVSLDGKKLAESDRSLISLSSRLQNTNMTWDGTQTVHNNWGSSPTLMEPRDLRVQLTVQADSLRIYPLDATGQESTFFTIPSIAPNLFEVLLDQSDDPTPWFGIEARGNGSPLSEEGEIEPFSLNVFPNPASDVVVFQFDQLSHASAILTFFDIMGRKVGSWEKARETAGMVSWTVPVSDLADGVYTYRIQVGEKVMTGKLVIQ